MPSPKPLSQSVALIQHEHAGKFSLLWRRLPTYSRRVIATAHIPMRFPSTVLCFLAGTSFTLSFAQGSNELSTVTVIATTPIPGTGQAKEELPFAVQTATQKNILESQALNLSDFLNYNFSGVHVNDNVGNPFQMDVNYRGYTASPLLGTPQGLSVYMDGVRLNQPFGDIVLWDLVPTNAIASATLMAGSNPLFGLNTLGGAISLQTKDGLSSPGTDVEVGVGSYGRRSIEIETGGSNDKGLNWYGSASDFAERGWRVSSPSQVEQLFGKLGWRDSQTKLNLTAAYFQSALTGNGLQESQLLATSYNSVFTIPDNTTSYAGFFNLQGERAISDRALLTGNIYYRSTTTNTLNSDLNGNSLGENVYGFNKTEGTWLANNGYLPQNTVAPGSSATGTGFPYLRCLAQAGLNTEPNEKCDALLTSTGTTQKNFGFSGQISFLDESSRGKNDLVLGAAFDASKTHFVQSSQFGYLNPDRTMTLVNAFADGTQNSESAFDQRVNLSGTSRTWSIFGNDTFSPSKTMHLTASARFNSTSIQNTDNLYPYNNSVIQNYCTAHAGACDISGNNPDGSPIYQGIRGSLSGDHSYSRLNPAIGVAFTPSPAFNPYIGYSESSRAPTSIELGCANPNFGCRLPTGMSGDPNLNQVVTKTWEIGARGRLTEPALNWSAALFSATNHDDILFVATNTTGTGYFKNFGETRRQGLELALSGEQKRLQYAVNYTYINATYQSTDTLGSQYNAQADGNGNIQVHPGDQMPLVPHHLLNARLSYKFTPSFRSGLSMIASSSSFVVGNENNLDPAKVPGSVVINWNGEYAVSQKMSIRANISNLFNARYYTSGQLGPYAFTSSGAYTNNATAGSTFYTPGAPRSLWVSLRYAID